MNTYPRVSVRVVRALLLAATLAMVTIFFRASLLPCGFARVFHVPCPTCGSTRAMLALAAGDIHGVVRFNPLAPFFVLLLIVLSLQAMASILATGTLQQAFDGKVSAIALRAALVVATLQALLWVARFFGFFGGPVPL